MGVVGVHGCWPIKGVPSRWGACDEAAGEVAAEVAAEVGAEVAAEVAAGEVAAGEVAAGEVAAEVAGREGRSARATHGSVGSTLLQMETLSKREKLKQ